MSLAATARRLSDVQPQTYGNYIDGEWGPAASGATFENRDPAHPDDLLGEFASSGAEDVRAAITAATEAATPWARTSAVARAAILYK
nr:aldehyde dehydrogenase family protein [Chloroflexota bacterium]